MSTPENTERGVERIIDALGKVIEGGAADGTIKAGDVKVIEEIGKLLESSGDKTAKEK